jgi:hypothetical protein
MSSSREYRKAAHAQPRDRAPQNVACQQTQGELRTATAPAPPRRQRHTYHCALRRSQGWRQPRDLDAALRAAAKRRAATQTAKCVPGRVNGRSGARPLPRGAASTPPTLAEPAEPMDDSRDIFRGDTQQGLGTPSSSLNLKNCPSPRRMPLAQPPSRCRDCSGDAASV